MIRSIRNGVPFLSVVLLLTGCGPGQEQEPLTPLPGDAQAVSVLGDTLYPPPLNEETKTRFEDNLAEAEADYRQNPKNPEAVIWYGRRMAYLGHYRKAIEIFSEGIERHPADARFYRHRGHRFITIREFDRAVNDLEKAVKLIRGTEDQIEPDGLPNEMGIPLSTLHFNVWYHLGLAYYLKGDYAEAERAWRECLSVSQNDDLYVATTYWLYLTLKKRGKHTEAEDALVPIHDDMVIIENDSYYRLLLMYKEELNPEIVIKRSEDPLTDATIGYGTGIWHLFNGRKSEAVEVFEEIMSGPQWPAFGYIAAEVELVLSLES